MLAVGGAACGPAAGEIRGRRVVSSHLSAFPTVGRPPALALSSPEKSPGRLNMGRCEVVEGAYILYRGRVAERNDGMGLGGIVRRAGIFGFCFVPLVRADLGGPRGM